MLNLEPIKDRAARFKRATPSNYTFHEALNLDQEICDDLADLIAEVERLRGTPITPDDSPTPNVGFSV